MPAPKHPGLLHGLDNRTTRRSSKSIIPVSYQKEKSSASSFYQASHDNDDSQAVPRVWIPLKISCGPDMRRLNQPSHHAHHLNVERSRSVTWLRRSRRHSLVLVMALGGARAHWTLTDSYKFISRFVRAGQLVQRQTCLYSRRGSRRLFHEYFVTHLPSSSLHPDSRSSTGLAHKLPRKDSTPHNEPTKSAPASHPSQMVGVSRDTTVVRIPLKSAKHHFGASVSRGSRPYNEDAYQAGVIELPAFAKRPPISLTRKRSGSEPSGEGTSAQGASGDPQVFYFGIFDGHGGAACSGFLRERLHEYIERTATDFEMQSSLQQTSVQRKEAAPGGMEGGPADLQRSTQALDSIKMTSNTATVTAGEAADGRPQGAREQYHPPYPGDPPLIQGANKDTMISMEKQLVQNWKQLVGGYFRRFKPAYFSLYGGYQALGEESKSLKARGQSVGSGAGIEEVMTYAFLKADYDFVSAQAAKEDQHDDQIKAERPLNDEEVLGEPYRHAGEIGGPKRFKGGSTCTVAMVSTPSPTPFWNPATTSSMLIAHVGDTRVIICSTATGAGIPLTSDHHPSSPVESTRLRRYAATFVTDSFGEERISGLANTRAFGDMASKRIGVSAEPDIKRVELGAAEYSFIVMVSDGVSGTLNDQEIVDIVKEAKTPEQAARDVVSFATEVSDEGDNATCIVVRMGGWERRQEGGTGSLGTKESREWKREEASGPRNRR